MKTLGNRIHSRMTEIRMDQVDLADRSGVSQATISRIINGHIWNPHILTLAPIARALRVTIDWILGETDLQK